MLLMPDQIHQFRTIGVAEFQPISARIARSWANRVIEIPEEAWIANEVTTEFDDVCKYAITDGPTTKMFLPEVFELYEQFRGELEELVEEGVHLSKWEKATVNINRMKWKDRIGMHVDSNPLTVLLSLGHGNPTDFVLEDESVISYVPKPGAAFVFWGKALPHRVREEPYNRTRPRLTLPFNYYVDSDFSRPDWFDDYVYGNVSYGEVNAKG